MAKNLLNVFRHFFFCYKFSGFHFTGKPVFPVRRQRKSFCLSPKLLETIMKKTFLSILFCVIALTISVQAQNNSRLADRLVTQTGSLSDKLYNDFRSRTSSSRSDLEPVFLAQQIDSSARLYQQMVRDNRRDSELRDAAGILSDLSRRAPAFGSNGYLWREVQSTIRELQGAVGGGGYGDNRGNDNNNDRPDRNDRNDRPDRPVSGRVTWRGSVDIEVQLVIKGSDLETRTISGTPYNNGSFNFTSALPTRNMTVEVNKKKGRGNVNVIQQPTRSNDYTTVIQIFDKDNGAKEYELDIYWR